MHITHGQLAEALEKLPPPSSSSSPSEISMLSHLVRTAQMLTYQDAKMHIRQHVILKHLRTLLNALSSTQVVQTTSSPWWRPFPFHQHSRADDQAAALRDYVLQYAAWNMLMIRREGGQLNAFEGVRLVRENRTPA